MSDYAEYMDMDDEEFEKAARYFKDTLYDYRLKEEWFSYERERMRDYVSDELGCRFGIEG